MKKILALLLVVLVFSGSALAFAWWDNLETTEEDVTIGIGEGVTISVDLDEKTDGNLVPSGVVMKEDDVTEVEIDFIVTLDSTDLVDPLDLNVTIDNIEIGGSVANANLVNAEVKTNPGTIQNAPVTVVLTVTLNEPTDETEYDAVANQAITFDVTFEAEQQ